MEKIFVYGTLRPPQPETSPEDSRYFLQIQELVQSHTPAHLPGAILYDLGTYPGATPGDGEVHGDLLTVPSAALKILDRIEGHPNFYRRELATVHSEQGGLEAWVYWAPEDLASTGRRVPTGDWFQRGIEGDESQAKASSYPPVDSTLQKLVERFAEAECSWLSSVRRNGRAHTAPVWHVWDRGRIYIVTTIGAVKTANIRENPSVVIALPDPLNAVILEGWATLVNNPRPRLQPLFQAKYDWDLDDDDEYDTVIEITPTKLMAWGEHGEGRWSGVEVMRVRVG
jgi:gamma-glutamylcyclotransferase (GGCT)/AIG2-like uncharacterized protein YtfP/general stress protein 26